MFIWKKDYLKHDIDDIFHAVNTKLNGLKDNKLYAYLSDDSIDTALKKITGTN